MWTNKSSVAIHHDVTYLTVFERGLAVNGSSCIRNIGLLQLGSFRNGLNFAVSRTFGNDIGIGKIKTFGDTCQTPSSAMWDSSLEVHANFVVEKSPLRART